MHCIILAMVCCLHFTLSGPGGDNDTLPLNKIQVIGSHNSYKSAIDPRLFSYIQSKDSEAALELDYEHIALSNQLNLGLENLELDVYDDPKGGLFAHPKGLKVVSGQKSYDPDSVMFTKGFKILHVPDIDFRSNVPTLIIALKELKKWSEEHKNHMPVFITIEPKDEPGRRGDGFVTPLHFTKRTFRRLDHVFIKYLGRKNMLIPSQIKGDYPTLRDAVLHGNWPTVAATRGKFIFILDAVGEKRRLYLAGHPSLKGRVMFANVSKEKPEAAIMILNDPEDPRIKRLVKLGFIIRTRADADTKEARREDYARFKKACNSGAQIISTDYYLESTHFASHYKVVFPDGSYSRVNPIFKL